MSQRSLTIGIIATALLVTAIGVSAMMISPVIFSNRTVT